ncbi:hypothetical protein HF325_002185 [Metschnikowia pulcherrima]|uniref:Uncharacterized protein n=1 Tax=Metschnikowia pulcherrima TaxID=27326 RepID=A0A8H7LCV7_9ASCO|nr:hypothetical protein HF325_002185 [Metschnikowia pulcherrima]
MQRGTKEVFDQTVRTMLNLRTLSKFTLMPTRRSENTLIMRFNMKLSWEERQNRVNEVIAFTRLGKN